MINKESNSKPTLSKSNSKELSAEKSREILRSVKHSADSENLKQDPVKKKVISIIQDSDMADDYSNKTKIAEFVQQHSKKIMSKNTNSKVVKPKGSISTTINSSNVKADEERSLSKLSEDASRDLKLCNDYHKMLLEYKDLEQDTSTSQSNINLLERKSNNELSLAHSKLEMNNATHNRNKTIDSTDSLDQNKSGYNREFKLQSEKDDSIYPKSQTVQDESKPPLEVKSSKIEKNLPKEETPNDEEDIDDEAALKRTMESLKSLLGKLLYEEVYEIVKKNTPEEYYYIELNEISEIVRTQLGSDFKEEKINHAIDNILEIYKLIFAEREKNNMIDF